MDANSHRDVVLRAVIKVTAAWVILPLFLLGTAGDPLWWPVWAYCACLLVPMTIFMIHMARHDPEFLARRSTLREKERTQRLLIAWGTPLMVAVLAVPGLDHRYGWSHPPTVAVVAALAVSLAGYLAVVRVFQENRWAGRTIETYAGQRVIATGPYAIIRHPMYACALVLYVATPVALGSWYGVIPALAFIPVFVARILNEEQVLLRDLPGYEEYRLRVRYRLVPFAW